MIKPILIDIQVMKRLIISYREQTSQNDDMVNKLRYTYLLDLAEEIEAGLRKHLTN